MPRSLLALSLSSLALAACASGPSTSLVAPPQGEPAYEQPGEQHRWLQEGVGRFEGTLTAFLPGAPPEPVAARETVEAFGPFFTVSTFECEFMGRPYAGTGCVGYDASRGVFVGTWIDSMASYLAVMEGQMAEDGETLILRWQAADPATGAMAPHRSETVRPASDRYVSTFYMGPGEGVKTMVIEMRRVGS